MNYLKLFHNAGVAFVFTTALILTACSSSNNNPPADITNSGSIQDGPVSGGSLFVFRADQLLAALLAADGAGDRAAALAGASPVAQLTRDPVDGDQYSLPITGSLAGQALFFIFDSAGAVDETFSDQPFNLEAVAIAGAAGSQLQVNLTPHTTLASIQVRQNLDPDGDGKVISAAAIQIEADAAMANALDTYGTNDFQEPLFPGGEDPVSTTDIDLLSAGSTVLGLEIRKSAGLTGLPLDSVVWLFAADVADGVIDGEAPAAWELSPEEADHLMALSESALLGGEMDTDVSAVNCSGAAASLRRACDYEALDEFFIGRATCAHEPTEGEFEPCMVLYEDDRDELLEECGDIYEARLDLCDATANQPHDPAFGKMFAQNFVDPLLIGAGVPAHPYIPLVQGNFWEYEGTFEDDGEMITETITVTVTDKTKLIEGIRCLVVRDVVTIDGEMVEDTNDWFAQDTDGNIWYCGEEVRDFETFEGDEPANPELVAIDGAFKAGREGDEAGILLPSTLTVGDVFRQEVSFTNAEDAIEILATDASETVPAASCNGDCLVTLDFSPLDPGVEENKYYAPGIGMILEVNLETGDRVELISFSGAP